MTEHDWTQEARAPLPDAARERFSRAQRLSLVVGIAGLVLCGVAALFDVTMFFRAYLVAYVFVLGIALGSLAIIMVHHLSGGAWGMVIRRPLESVTRTLPLLAVLFVPLLFGLPILYPWAREAEVAADSLLQHKQPYLNVPFFIGRTVFYFAAWIGVAFFLNRWSQEQDEERAVEADARRFRLIAAPGLLLYGLTVTFAAIDWVMSLTPHWFSTMFGVLTMGGQALSGIAFAIAVLFVLSGYRPMAAVVAPSHFHDLGKLLLAFVMLWAYFSYSQFLIIWSANLPEETPWYLARTTAGWGAVALVLAIGHFALPFLLLLSRDLKRRAPLLTRVAVAVLLMRFVDLVWVVTPAFPDASALLVVVQVVALAGIGGIWLAAFLRQLPSRPLLPVRDPYFREAMEHAAH